MNKRKAPLTLIVVLIVTSFLLVIDIALGIVLVNTSSNSTKSILDNKMLELAQTAARLVDGDEIASLQPSDKDDPNCVAYTHNYDILSKFKTSGNEHGADLAYIYCLVKYNDKIVFSIDPDPEDPAVFMVEEPDPLTDGMVKAFTGVTAVDSQAVKDDWGVTYSAYAPIFKSDNSVAGVIGVDVWAQWYEDQIKQNIVTIVITSSLSIAGGVLIALLITYFLRRRLSTLSNEVKSLEGDVQTLLHEIRSSSDEMAKEEDPKNTLDMEEIRGQIQTAQQEIRRYIEYSHQRAYSDSLTKLNNRLAYFERVKALNEKIRDGENLSFIVMIYDVNGLKDINDTYGHEFGDIALVKGANIIRDIYAKENTYRIGGDEIVVILENIELDELDERTVAFNAELEAVNNMSTDLPVKLSMSKGIASFDKKKDKEFLDVFRRADKNMYENKDKFYCQSGVRHRK